jgi:hypothetical protein
MAHRTHIALAAILAIALGAAPAAAAPWPVAARAQAAATAARWSADVVVTSRLGAEPPGRCRPIDADRAACPIAIAILVRDAAARRPWRCSATATVSRAGDRLTSRRTATRCVPFPRPALPNGAASFGSAIALGANGDLACLTANSARTTCVMSYFAPSGERCVRATSIPLARPARSIALGGPICR